LGKGRLQVDEVNLTMYKRINPILKKIKEGFRSGWLFPAFLLFIAVGAIFFTNKPAEGKYSYDQISGTWEGDLNNPEGSAQKDVEEINPVGSVVISQNPATGKYEAKLSSTALSGSIISSTIIPDNTQFIAWKYVSVSVLLPTGAPNITVSVLCGEPTNPPCILNTPITDSLGNVLSNLVPANGVIDISKIPVNIKKIRLQANWSRPDTSTPSPILTSWSVNWQTTDSISLSISKTPSVANPKLLFGSNPDGAPAAYTVTYRIDYSLSKDVGNLHIQLPAPTVSYSGQSYRLVPKSGTGGAKWDTYKAWWDLGEKKKTTIGNVTFIFEVPTGPPDGVTFTTKAYANDGGSGTTYYSAEDSLPIKSNAYLKILVEAPERIGLGTTVNYMIYITGWSGHTYQSDIFNSKLTFNYTTNCLNYVETIGASATAVQGRVTITSGDFVLSDRTLEKKIVVRFTSTTSCSYSVQIVKVTITSDQDSTYIADKNTGVASAFTNIPKFLADKYNYTGETGAGRSIYYNMDMQQYSTVPITNFYLIDQVPPGTYYSSAGFYKGYLGENNISPVTNMKIFVSSRARSLGPPPQIDFSWIPINSNGSSPLGTNTIWVKWESAELNWDRRMGGYWPLINLQVVVADPVNTTLLTQCTIPGYTAYKCVVNKITYNGYGAGSKICPTSDCTDTVENPVTDQPRLVLYYVTYPSNYIAGDQKTELSIYGTVENNGSTGDAKNVAVTMYLPRYEFLYPYSSTEFVYAQADCAYTPGCPDINGTLKNPAPWLKGVYDPIASKVTWTIPLIYSSSKPGMPKPWSYGFSVKIKIKKGYPDGTIAICNTPSDGYWNGGTVAGTCVFRAQDGIKTNVRTEVSLPNPIIIMATINMRLVKTASDNGRLVPGLGSESPGLTYTLTEKVEDDSTTPVSNVFIVDNIPYNDTFSPPINLQYAGAGVAPGYNPNDVKIYYMLEANWSRMASSAPGSRVCSEVANVAPCFNWKLMPTSDVANVSWVLWKIISPIPIGGQFSVTLTVKATTKIPNDITFDNKGYHGYYKVAEGSDFFKGGRASIIITIYNPGFISTKDGDIGTFGPINIGRPAPSTSPYYKTATYLAIASGSINSNVLSLKNWLVGDYNSTEVPPGLNKGVLDFDLFLNEYRDKASADSCTGVENNNNPENCFNTRGGLRMHTGNLTIDTTKPGTYDGNPLILLIDGDLTVETNINIGTSNPNTGIIFEVKGNITIGSNVTRLDGIYIASGDFTTMSLSGTLTAGQNVGRLAAILNSAEAREYYSYNWGPKIAYIANDDVRYIYCNDRDCNSMEIKYLLKVNEATNIALSMRHPGASNLYGIRIMVGQEGGKAFYIDCSVWYACDSAYNTIKEMPNTWYPDIYPANKWGSDGPIYFSFGQRQTVDGNKFTTIGTCTYSWPYDNCSNPTLSPIDNGTANNNPPADVGNDTQISMDNSGAFGVQPIPVMTYVKREGNTASLFMTRQVGAGGNCPLNSSWSCSEIAIGSIGRFPSLAITTDGYSRIAYVDKNPKTLKYIYCQPGDKTCPQPTITTVNCSINGDSCEVLDYASLKLNTNNQPRIAFNVKYTDSASGQIRYALRFAWCDTLPCTDSASWHVQSIMSDVGAPGVQVYNEGLAMTARNTYTLDFDWPMMVFYKADTQDLMFVSCNDIHCDSSVAPPTIKVLDYGANLLLPDSQLTVNGAVIAFGKTQLNRTLLDQSGSKPGEIFNFLPRYFYIFHGIVKEQVRYQEITP